MKNIFLCLMSFMSCFLMQAKMTEQREQYLAERTLYHQKMFVGGVLLGSESASDQLKESSAELVMTHKIHPYCPGKKIVGKNIDNVLIMEQECGEVGEEDIKAMVKQDFYWWGLKTKVRKKCRDLWKDVKGKWENK